MIISPIAIGIFVVPTWNRFTNPADAGTKCPDAHPNRHRQKNPQRQPAVKK